MTENHNRLHALGMPRMTKQMVDIKVKKHNFFTDRVEDEEGGRNEQKTEDDEGKLFIKYF